MVKSTIWRATVPQGSFVYIPVGSFVLERSVGDNLVTGFRVSVVTIDAEVLDSFKGTTQAYGNLGAPLTKFLDEVTKVAAAAIDESKKA
eukprot:5000719-Pyramimonas_sp.AAC.1